MATLKFKLYHLIHGTNFQSKSIYFSNNLPGYPRKYQLKILYNVYKHTLKKIVRHRIGNCPATFKPAGFFPPMQELIYFLSNFKTLTLLHAHNLEELVCCFKIFSKTINLQSKGSSLLFVNFEIVGLILCRLKKLSNFKLFPIVTYTTVSRNKN